MTSYSWSSILAPVVRLFLLFFIVGPVVAGSIGILFPAFGWFPPLGGERLSFMPIKTMLSAPGMAHSVWLSLSTAMLATSLSYFSVMLFLAVIWERQVAQKLVKALSPLLSVPHVTIAVGLMFLLQPSGWFVRLISPALTGWERPPVFGGLPDENGFMLVFGLMAKEIPFLLLMTLSALSQLPARQWISASRTLGYGSVTSWFLIVQPNLSHRLLLPVLIVLVFSVSVVDMAVVLAPTTPPPLALRIMSWFQDPDTSARFYASAAALLQVFVAGFAVVLWKCGQWAGGMLLVYATRHGMKINLPSGFNKPVHILVTMLGVLPCFVGVMGLAVCLLWSFAEIWRFPDVFPSRFGVTAWSADSAVLLNAAINTALVGLFSAFIGLILAVLWFELTPQTCAGLTDMKATEMAIFIPLIVPQVAFLFGLQIMLVWLGLTGLYVTLIWAHLLFVFPYIVLSLGPAWRRWDRRLDDVGAGLGAGKLKRLFRIKLPVLIMPVMASFAVGFAVSAALYLPTIFAGGGRIMTLTTEAVTLASGAGRQALGLATMLQMALPLVVFFSADAASRIRVTGQVHFRRHR